MGPLMRLLTPRRVVGGAIRGALPDSPMARSGLRLCRTWAKQKEKPGAVTRMGNQISGDERVSNRRVVHP